MIKRQEKILEAKLEKRLVDKVTNLGGLAWKFTSQGTIGVPDRIVMFQGKLFFVEMKAPDKDLRKLQQWRKRQIEEQGFAVLRLRTETEVDDFIQKLAGKVGDWNAI